MMDQQKRINLNQTRVGLVLGVMVWLGTACTSTLENRENNALAPAVITTDAQRQAIYNNGGASRAPSSIPRNLNDQASEINRRKFIEERNTEKPNNKPPEVRTQELNRPTVDTLRRGL